MTLFKKGLSVFGALTVIAGVVAATISATTGTFTNLSATNATTTNLVVTNSASLPGTLTATVPVFTTGNLIATSSASVQTLNVTSTSVFGGAMTVAGVTNNGTSVVNGNLTVSSTAFFVDAFNKKVSVNTTTALGADFTVQNNTGAASSTIMVGTSYDGNKRGLICQWNGTNFTNTWYPSNSITATVVTSTSCP